MQFLVLLLSIVVAFLIAPCSLEIVLSVDSEIVRNMGSYEMLHITRLFLYFVICCSVYVLFSWVAHFTYEISIRNKKRNATANSRNNEVNGHDRQN